VKTIGLVGGMSWESSQEYYRIINEESKRRLGGLASAQSLMFSFNFAEVEELQSAGRWDETTKRMVEAGRRLERGGADFVVICSNTMHKMAREVQEGISIPLLHIADATGEAKRARRISKIGLLGTRYTMEEDFYKGRLEDNFELEVVIPIEQDRQRIHDVIYDELCIGEVSPDSKVEYLDIVRALERRGVQGVILGCTEIGLLVQQADTLMPVFDTTRIHAEAAVDMALP
jgi:aspartate racemase